MQPNMDLKVIFKFYFIYLKDSSNLLLFVLADFTDESTIFVVGFSELWTETAPSLEQEHNPASTSGK